MVYRPRNRLSVVLRSADDVSYCEEAHGWRDTKPDSVIDIEISKDLPEEVRAQIRAELAMNPFVYVREDDDVPVPVRRPVIVGKTKKVLAMAIAGILGFSIGCLKVSGFNQLLLLAATAITLHKLLP
ncbi:hypothetical protein C2S51_033094 [Perilla frutescens var. frutescens]|nr:hypothetical protein C2S51_033094 [Perilla frutescens var. frutescens]